MKKRGLFFTLGLGLFAFVILSLSIIASKHFGTYDDRFIELIAFNRMSDIDQSLQGSIKEIFEATSGIGIGVTPTQVTFEQQIPLNFARFNSSAETFYNYAVSNDRKISMDFSDVRKSLPIWIRPNNILYSQNISQNYITIMPSSTNIGGYSIRVSLGNSLNITSCSKSMSQGIDDLTIEIIGSNGTSCSSAMQANISSANNVTANSVSVATISGGGIKISTPGMNITVSSTVKLLAVSEDLPAAYLPDNIISIDLANLGLSKNSTVKLA